MNILVRFLAERLSVSFDRSSSSLILTTPAHTPPCLPSLRYPCLSQTPVHRQRLPPPPFLWVIRCCLVRFALRPSHSLHPAYVGGPGAMGHPFTTTSPSGLLPLCVCALCLLEVLPCPLIIAVDPACPLCGTACVHGSGERRTEGGSVDARERSWVCLLLPFPAGQHQDARRRCQWFQNETRIWNAGTSQSSSSDALTPPCPDQRKAFRQNTNTKTQSVSPKTQKPLRSLQKEEKSRQMETRQEKVHTLLLHRSG
jgi:hypothetical protein